MFSSGLYWPFQSVAKVSFCLSTEMTLLQKKTFRKQSHRAPLWSQFALFRSKGQICDSLTPLKVKTKKKHVTSLQGRQDVFQITNSALFGFLESWRFSTICSFAKFQSRKISASLTRLWSIFHIHLSSVKHPPGPLPPPFRHLSPFHGAKNHFGCPQMNRSGSGHPPPAQGRIPIDKERAAALLPVLGPGLEVLQGVQGGVMGAQWV